MHEDIGNTITWKIEGSPIQCIIIVEEDHEANSKTTNLGTFPLMLPLFYHFKKVYIYIGVIVKILLNLFIIVNLYHELTIVSIYPLYMIKNY